MHSTMFNPIVSGGTRINCSLNLLAVRIHRNWLLDLASTTKLKVYSNHPRLRKDGKPPNLIDSSAHMSGTGQTRVELVQKISPKESTKRTIDNAPKTR